MKEQILSNINNPGPLERFYRSNKGAFKKDFNSIYPEVKGNMLADFWNERLNFEQEDVTLGSVKDLTFVLLASFIAGMIAKLPAIFGIDEEFFYPRNIGFIVFPMLAAYFAWK